METWTDDQLQTQLDVWTTLRNFGAAPTAKLTAVPGTSHREPMSYILRFNDVAIRLTYSQAQRVEQWMGVCHIQVQANKLDSMLPVTPNEVLQNTNKPPRDTQFLGFAKLVGDEIIQDSMATTSDYWSTRARTIIAQRAYDLACHVLIASNNGLSSKQMDYIKERMMIGIDDLTAETIAEWPMEK